MAFVSHNGGARRFAFHMAAVDYRLVANYIHGTTTRAAAAGEREWEVQPPQEVNPELGGGKNRHRGGR